MLGRWGGPNEVISIVNFVTHADVGKVLVLAIRIFACWNDVWEHATNSCGVSFGIAKASVGFKPASERSDRVKQRNVPTNLGCMGKIGVRRESHRLARWFLGFLTRQRSIAHHCPMLLDPLEQETGHWGWKRWAGTVEDTRSTNKKTRLSLH
jgi:hypothetical protein